MNEQSSKEAILQKTLYTLVRRVGLSSQEVAGLRLSDLHLAGKNPNISFTPSDSNKPKTIELDLETHRALVGWLVARPDSASDFLFLEGKADPLGPAVIEQAITSFEQSDLDLGDKAVDDVLSEPPETGSSTPDERMADVPPGGATSPAKPPPVNPIASPPPPSTPEMGAPPPGVRPAQPFPPPPGSVPEGSRLPGPPQPLPGAPQPLPGQGRYSGGKPGQGPRPLPPNKSGSMPKSVNTPRTRVPPKPVRKKGADQTPVIVQQKEPDQAKSEPTAQPPASPVAKDLPKTADAPPPEIETPSPKRASKPYTSASQAVTAQTERGNRPAILSLTIGGILTVLALCVVCISGVGWFALRNEAGGEIVASLGLSNILGEDILPGTIGDSGDEMITLVTPSPIPSFTPTLPPTNTPTLLPPTSTPVPTETPTLPPTPTVVPPTDTPLPIPTDTPVPSDTPTSEAPPPAATPTPANTPTPAATPTPAMKYEAPVLLEPEHEFRFIGGNTIVLRWQPVDLAPDEQYAVRLVYRFNNQLTYQGGNIKESEWIVPLSLFGQIDPPDNYYEWFVVIERLNEDGSGTAISPESERRSFTWK